MMTDVSYAFGVTTDPPVDRRPGGRGRPRTNVYDSPVRQSYDEGWADRVSDEAPTGLWHYLLDPISKEPAVISKEEAQRITHKIRSSASHWSKVLGKPVGTNVRWNPDNGVLQFRGVEKSKGDKASNEGGEIDPAVTHDVETRGEEWTD